MAKGFLLGNPLKTAANEVCFGDTIGLFILAFCFLKGTIHKIVGDHSEPFTKLWGTIENYSQVVGRYSELFTHCGWGRYSELFPHCGALFRTIYKQWGAIWNCLPNCGYFDGNVITELFTDCGTPLGTICRLWGAI